MHGSYITFATPKRLIRRKDGWSMDVERLHPVGEGVLRPQTEQVKGEIEIIDYLKHIPDAQSLLESAAGLISEGQNGVERDRVFEALGPEWVPASSAFDEGTSFVPKKVASEISAARRDLSSLKTEQRQWQARMMKLEERPSTDDLLQQVLQMASEQNRILERLSNLEKAVGVALPRPLEPKAVPPPPQDNEPPVAGSDGAQAGRVDDDGSVSRAAAAASLADAFAAQTEDEDDKHPDADGTEHGLGSLDGLTVEPEGGLEPKLPKPNGPPVKLPDAAAVSDMLMTMLGDEYAVSEMKAPLDLTFDPDAGPYYWAKLLDDDGVLVGAIVADLKATVHQGGTLMMQEESQIASQISEKNADEDAIEGMAEILNTLAGAINKIPKNTHVVCQRIEPMPGTLWGDAIAARSEFVDINGAKLVMLSRSCIGKAQRLRVDCHFVRLKAPAGQPMPFFVRPWVSLTRS